MNASDVLVAVLVAGLAVLAVRNIRKRNKTGCCGSCGDCGGTCACHEKKPAEDTRAE